MSTNFQDLSAILAKEHCDDVQAVMQILNEFHRQREATYDLSFAKRGEVGIWINLARKTDRLDKVVAKVLEGELGYNVVLVDTLVDTALYAMKWLSVIRTVRPNDWRDWFDVTYDPEAIHTRED